MPDPQTRHHRGLIVVAFLAIVFLALIALIVFKSRKSEPKHVQTAETLTVLPIRIRIRTEPQARAAVIATATSGDTLTLVEDRGAWVRVRTSDGLEGWAERANLERTAERQRRIARFEAIRHLPPLKGITTERTQLYAGPGIFYPLVGEIDKGTNVVVYTRDHDFYAIDRDGTIAYAGVDSVDLSASGTRQVEVQTASTDTSATDTAAPSETTPEETPAPPVAEEVPPAAEPQPAPGGVYAAVPYGGTQPEEIDRVMPHYPPGARARGVQGPVVVRGIVRRDGTIDNVEVIRDLPYGLGDEARRAVSRWRFRPATFRGEPIDVYYTVTVNFRLQ